MRLGAVLEANCMLFHTMFLCMYLLQYRIAIEVLGGLYEQLGGMVKLTCLSVV